VLLQMEFDHLGANFGEDFVADFQAVEEASGHGKKDSIESRVRWRRHVGGERSAGE
jgi:hypothetical protein